MARRVVGHDRHGAICFHAYDYQTTQLRSDDDLEYYETITYAESMTAWRLLSGQWLSTHWLMPFGDEEEGRTRVRLTQRMP